MMSKTNTINLYQGNQGDFIRITTLSLEGVMRRRLLELGFVPGVIIEVLNKSHLGDPIAFRVSQTTIALKRRKLG
jgi:ferrous iron transport protein A